MTKDRLVDRLAEAGLETERFVQCVEGRKGTHDHTLLSPDVVSGVYGVYATGDDGLVWLDVDDYEDIGDKSGLTALMKLPPTLEQHTPHGGKHRAYKVTTDDDRTAAEVLEEAFGRVNLQPSWGDVRAKNGYVVGAGSELSECDKDDHDCSEDGEGEYVLEEDREIAEITASRLVDALRQDPVYSDDGEESDETADTSATTDPAEVLSYALNDSDDEKLKRLWRGDYSDYGNDRSRAESALAYKLAFWLQGDKQAVRRAMNGENVPSDVPNPQLAKWEDRGDSYRDSVLTAVDKQTDHFEPSGGRDGRPDVDDLHSPDLEDSDLWVDIQMLYEDPEIQKRYARQAAAERLLDEYDFATTKDDETIWVYDDEWGVFEPTGETVVQTVLAEKLGAWYTQQEKNEILGKIRARTFVDRDEFDAGDRPLVCLGNGVYNFETGELLDHSPEYLFTRGVRHDHDPDADGDAVEEFLDTIVRREEDKLTLLEMVGACLSPTYERGKFMILFGEGANGKSTFFDMVTELLGSDNVSGWELQKLSDNQFASSDLVGKFANIAPDMPGTKLNELGTLKTLTGNDTTMAEKKGQPAFEFQNTATLMFGANRPPVIPEASRAVKRRLVPIRLPKNFTNQDDDNPDARDKEELLDELTTEEQMSGLLNMALEGLQRLRDQGDVSLPETHEERLEYYEQFSDPIKEFRVNCLENEAGTELKKSSIYDAYKRFCRDNDYSVKQPNVFWKTLRQTTLLYDESRPMIDGQQQKVLNDVKFTEAGLEYSPQAALEDLGGPGDQDEIDPVDVDDLGDHEGETVDVRVAFDYDQKESGHGSGDGPLLRGTASDETGEVSVVSWTESESDDATQLTPWPLLESADAQDVVIENAYVNTYEGALQLKLQDRTVVREDPGENATLGQSAGDADGETAADGGTATESGPPDDATGRKANALRLAKVMKSNGIVGPDGAKAPPALVGKVDDMNPTEVERALQYGSKKVSPAWFARNGDEYYVLENWG